MITVEELIKELEAMPKKSKVVFYGDRHFYDVLKVVDDEYGEVTLTDDMDYEATT